MAKPADRNALRLRQDYFDDPAGWRALIALLRDIFDIDISPLERLGGFDRSSLASAFFDADGLCIANLSAFAMPLMIDGRIVRAGAWQSGAVRPSHRGQGLFRALIRITLDRCKAAGFEALVLYTSKPDLYTPYGFTAVPQFTFLGPPPAPLKTSTPARRLRFDDAGDLQLMQKLLAERMPVSRHFAVAGQAEMFLLNSVLIDGICIDYLPDQQAAVAWRRAEDGAFELLDVVAGNIPTLATILAALGLRPQRITLQFPPDRLDWHGAPQPDEGPVVLMMRCDPALIPRMPVCLSPMAEF